MGVPVRLIGWAAALVAGLAGAGYVLMPVVFGKVERSDLVVRSDVVQSVVASGHVEAPYRINIGAQTTGLVVDVPVSEGQMVRSGETLLVLDDREQRAAVLLSEGAVAQAEARLRQLRELTLPSAQAAMMQARATLTGAQQIHDRAEKLASDGYGTKASLQEAIKALDIASAQVRSAELLVFTSKPGGSDYVTAETQLAQAKAGLEAAHSRLSYTIIRAPRDGTLIARTVERGYIVQPSGVLMVLSPTGDTQLVVQIDEKNLGLLALGQKALASTDAYPGDVFAAELVFINPGIDLQRASVEVKLRVLTPKSSQRQDMTVSVDIEVARRIATLIVPATSLRSSPGSPPWVMALVDGRAHRQSVKTGISGGGKVEILSGLGEGDRVLPANLVIAEGARVRAQATGPKSP